MAKGAMQMWFIVIFLFVALLALFAISGILAKESKKGASIPTAILLKSQVKNCQLLMQRAEKQGIMLDDADGDGSPNVCDICPGTSGTDDTNDGDQDGIPDGCDKNPSLTSIQECINGWDKKRGRCNPA